MNTSWHWRRYQLTLEAKREYDRLYAQSHKAEKRAYDHERYRRLSAVIRERSAKRYHEQREAILEQMKDYVLYRRDPIKRAQVLRRYKLKHFGLTIEQYESMYAAQKGVCAICGCPSRDRRRLAVDHCHKTGKVRGLLCHGCNVSLGFADDNIEIFERMILYLLSGGVL